MATIENGCANAAIQGEISPLHLENLHRDLTIMRDVVGAAVGGRLNRDALRGVAYGLEVWETITKARLSAISATTAEG